jgi:hypothetical protein
MTASRRLEWDKATFSNGAISVPLDGSPDDYWLDRFHQARAEAKQSRAARMLPHIQIELRDHTIAATGIPAAEQDLIRELLNSLVAAANHTSAVGSITRRAG